MTRVYELAVLSAVVMEKILFAVAGCLLFFQVLTMMNNGDDEDGGGNGNDEDNAPMENMARRHRVSYSLQQKLNYIDDYVQAHLLGEPHAITPTHYARHHRIHPRTFADWLANEDEIRNLMNERPNICGRRRRQRNHAGNNVSTDGHFFNRPTQFKHCYYE